MGGPKVTVVSGKRECTKCHQWKLLEDFFKDTRTVYGVSARCKNCVYTERNRRYKEEPEFKAYLKIYRDRHTLFSRYGISKNDVDEMLLEQSGHCAICGYVFDLTAYPREYNIDHDHVTGKVRKLLCKDCNLGLGNFKDNQQLLAVAINYLKEFD